MNKSYLILLSSLVLAACTLARPPLIWNLPHEIVKVDQAFDQRVKEKYPPGTPEEEVISSLKQQGFSPKVSDTGGHGSFEIMQIACKIRYGVSWKTDENKNIEKTTADVNHTCL